MTHSAAALLLVAAVCLGSAVAQDFDLHCERGWTKVGRYCYKALEASQSYESASKACSVSDAYPLSLHAAGQAADVLQSVKVSDPVWLGAVPLGSIWVWADKSEWDYDAFSADQHPVAGSCASVLCREGVCQWNLVPCASEQRVVCAHPAGTKMFAVSCARKAWETYTQALAPTVNGPQISLNGVPQVVPFSAGLNLYAFDKVMLHSGPTANLVLSSTSRAADLVRFLHKVDGQLVVASCWESCEALTPAVRDALAAVGATRLQEVTADASYLFMFTAGGHVHREVVSSSACVHVEYVSGTSVVCPVGTYRAGSLCMNCAPGTYSNALDVAQCFACPAGTYTDQFGSKACVTCPEGFYCPTGSSKALPCAAGTYGYAGENRRTCAAQCPEGHYCPEGTGAVHMPFQTCNLGTWSVSGAESPRCPINCHAANARCPPRAFGQAEQPASGAFTRNLRVGGGRRLETVSSSNSSSNALLKSVDFSQLIVGPFSALVDAQILCAQSTVDYVMTVGFDQTVNPPVAKTVSFMFNQADSTGQVQKTQIDVPVITMVPIPSLSFSGATLNFNVKIVEMKQESSSVGLNTAMSGQRETRGTSSKQEFGVSLTLLVEPTDLPDGVTQLFDRLITDALNTFTPSS